MLADLLTASLAAYGFARLRFKGRDLVFALYLSTMILPGQMLLVPRFVLFQYLHIYDTPWALILPNAFTPFGTFLLRQFLLTIPSELSDAARIDGANKLQIYWRVMLPLLRPALGSLAIVAFVWSWNEYETALVMLTSESIYTIPLGMTKYFDDRGAFQPLADHGRRRLGDAADLRGLPDVAAPVHRGAVAFGHQGPERAMGAAVKIGVIGAASAEFSLGLVRDLCLAESLDGSLVSLMDPDADRLATVHRLAVRYAAEMGADVRFEATTERGPGPDRRRLRLQPALVGGHK